MNIRSIDEGELAAFACFSENEQLNSSLARHLAGLWAIGSSRPAWCFVAEGGSLIRGRIAYWGPPFAVTPMIIEFLDVPWTGDYLEVGSAMLRETLGHWRRMGATTMRYLLDQPSYFETYPEQRTALLENVGFSLRRKGERWEWNAVSAPVPTNRLRFRPITEVAEDTLIEALTRAMEGTLDHGLQQDRRRLGAEGAAQAYLTTARSLPGAATGGHLGYTIDGSLVGVVMPGANDGGPIINFLGVVPEQRGHGYGSDLLAMGIATLQAAGARRIRSDADRDNIPMAVTFQRAGFRKFQTRAVYEIELSNVDLSRDALPAKIE